MAAYVRQWQPAQPAGKGGDLEDAHAVCNKPVVLDEPVLRESHRVTEALGATGHAAAGDRVEEDETVAVLHDGFGQVQQLLHLGEALCRLR